MKNSLRALLVFSLSILLFFFVSCMDDMDDVVPKNRDMLQASEFVYRAMNFFYLYKANTPELANDYFTSDRDKTDFITSFQTPESLFDYLKYDKDQFSVLVDDYVELERSLQGKSLSTGAIFLGIIHENDFYLLVRNVIENSSAYDNNVVRGDIFHAINGQTITQNNVNELLNSATLTFSYAYETNTGYEKSNDTVTLQTNEIDEPSIGMHKILNVSGTKVGYLMYNSFIGSYNHELNEIFRYFREEAIDELVVDLRYNTGGSIYSAELLSTMITGQFKGEIIYENEWNADLQSYYGETVFFSDKFNSGETIESLRLPRVAILTQSRTASASELVINALNPYINVIQVGTATRGKYQGSILIYDSSNFINKQQINPNHRYAMLPLVLKTKNSQGFTDFDDGLPADIPYLERIGDIKDNLGTLEEPLLREALQGLGLTPPPARRTKTEDYFKVTPVQVSTSNLDGIMYFERMGD